MYKCICGYKTPYRSSMENHLQYCSQAKQSTNYITNTTSLFDSCCSYVSDYSSSSSYDSGSSYSGGGGSFDGGGSSDSW